MLLAVPAMAQEEVTIRQINQIPAEQLNELKQRGADLTNDQVTALVRSAYAGQEVRFRAVVLSDPRKSGLANPTAAGSIGRIHIFVRDVNAETEGPQGMDLQIVDEIFDQTGSMNLFIGDVIDVVGVVNYFGATIQTNIVSLEVVGDVASEGLSQSILDPVVTTTDEIMVSLGELSVQPDWDRFGEFNNQFVRIEGATVWRSPNRTDDRPNYIITSDNAQTFLHSADHSLRYRNDRASYPDDFDKRDDTFEAPPAGATINIEGFIVLSGTFSVEPIGTPTNALFKIAPWTDDDIEITAEPLIQNLEFVALDRVVGNEDVEVTLNYDADAAGDATSATLFYSVAGGAEQEVAMTTDNGSFTATIPAQADGAFVTYRAEVTDRTGADYSSPFSVRYRVLYDGITEIRHIRETATGLRAASPFVDQTVDMNIVARVQNDPDASGLLVIQDNEDLEPWSGVWVRTTAALMAAVDEGTEIRITRGTVEYQFQVTFLRVEEFEVLDTETAPYPYKVVSTSILQDAAIAEPHVGMLLRFEDVVITNPDAGFGEWAFSTEPGGSDPVLADDLSAEFSDAFASSTFQEGDQLTYLQGAWYYSFGNYKLIPMVALDIGDFVGTSVEDELASEFALAQNYPNPFNPTTRIEYRVPATGHVTLEVFDVLGRRVATLVNGTLPAGTHAVTFDANHLTSGLYVYQLRAGDRITSRTMMLVK
jgi:hypothetical protein